MFSLRIFLFVAAPTKWRSSIGSCKKKQWQSSLSRFSQIWLFTKNKVQIFNRPSIFLAMSQTNENQIYEYGKFCFSFFFLLHFWRLKNSKLASKFFSNFQFPLFGETSPLKLFFKILVRVLTSPLSSSSLAAFVFFIFLLAKISSNLA